MSLPPRRLAYGAQDGFSALTDLALTSLPRVLNAFSVEPFF